MTKLRTPGLLVTLGKKSRTLGVAVASAIAIAVLMLAAPGIAQNPATASTAAVRAGRRKPVRPGSRLVVIDPTNRTVTTSSFAVGWSTSNDTEAITSMIWHGGSNLTSNQGLGTCFPQFPGAVEYFGNSWAPPDPFGGGLVLVGGGTTTPQGTTAWSGQILASGTAQVIINSRSTDCPPSSAGINVQTTYNFVNPDDPATTWFGVQRAFDFTTGTFAHDFRPYMARLNLDDGFTETLYPDTSGALATINVNNCGSGCTGPIVIPNASLLTPAWDATKGWFAIHNPNTLKGVVVARNPSVDPQGNPIAAQLWVDDDGGTDTNVTSFLLMSPTAGFTGGLVTETETLCFYDSSTWTPSMTPPAPCNGSATTSTTLTSSLNPSNYGQSVTFTATVTASSGTPTGTVIFYDAASQLGSATLANGSTSLSTSSLSAGSRSITAAYQGSDVDPPSTSAPLIQVVNGINTTTALFSSLNPSLFGQTVTFTASVNSASGTPDGTVVFYDGATQIGSATLAGGSASLSTASLSASSHSITAAYQGSGMFAPSTSTPLIQVVNSKQAATATSVASSHNPCVHPCRLTFTATVTSSSGTPDGTVVFFADSIEIGSATLSGGIAALTYSGLHHGSHPIIASYQGSADFSPSTSPALNQVVFERPFATHTQVFTSGSPSFVGQPVTFSADVEANAGPGVPAGEPVTFLDGDKAIGTVVTGAAHVTISTLSQGRHTIFARYPGDGINLKSHGRVTQFVVKYPTTITLVSSLNPAVYGQPITYTVTVTSSSPNPLTGKVTLTDIGSLTLVNGVASITKDKVRAGTHALTAEYLGDDFAAKSTSQVLEQVVKPASTTTTIASSLNPSKSGQNVTFTATVLSSTGLDPYGTVTFTAGSLSLGTVALKDTKASVSTSMLPVGSTLVTATYSGADGFTGSASSLTQVVQP